ncbi:MAG: hypothetical protein J0I09_02595 [Sphingobacteriia bacterium]|nr:hypothetical protein [Sphingobacteriia bacterium]
MQTRFAFVKTVFFGNYFYGICAVALSVEAALQQHYPLNDWLYYVACFSATVVFYTKAYIADNKIFPANARAGWYAQHRYAVSISQLILTILVIGIALYLLLYNLKNISQTPVLTWFVAASFPLAGIGYYGFSVGKKFSVNLRNAGWLKPFLIGFVWGGLVNVYPVIYYNIVHRTTFQIEPLNVWLFLKNFMFITVLCIMFDIKDYATDYNLKLKTFVVRVGLRKTIFLILLPLCVLGLGSFLVYGFIHHFHPMKMIFNTIPFILLITVAYSMHQRKSILYYLAIIDGLMLIKAICGSIAMIYF